MLPEGFKWQSIYGPAGPEPYNALAYKMSEVARLDEKVGGGWIALLRYPDGRRVSRQCSSFEAGRAGCVAWAIRHRDALVAKIEVENLRRVARRSYDRDAAHEARRKLEEMGINPDEDPSPSKRVSSPDPRIAERMKRLLDESGDLETWATAPAGRPIERANRRQRAGMWVPISGKHRINVTGYGDRGILLPVIDA